MLDSDRQLFESELKLTQDRANELLAVIALYRALGGGWQTQADPGTSPPRGENFESTRPR